MSTATIFKVDKTNNYTVMSNQHFHVLNMSLRAKGLLSLILSLPDTWDYSIAGLASLCKESTPTVRAALKELENLGYLYIEKELPNKANHGRYTYKYHIYENSKTPDKLEMKWGKINNESE